MHPRWSSCLAYALLACAASGALAAPDDPAEALQAWTGAPVAAPALEPEPPLLELGEQAAPLAARLTDLAARRRWVELAELLSRISDGQVLDGSLVRVRGPGLPLLDAREDVARRLRRLPPAVRDAYEAMVGPRTDLLLREGRRHDAPLGELLGRFGATPAAGQAAQALGERLLERGDLAGAALLWRRALAQAPDAALARRLLALRTLLGVEVEGSLAPRLPGAPAAWSVRWARRAGGGDRTLPRAVTADGAHVYLSDRRGVLALAREDGRLVWRVPLRGDPSEQRLVLGADHLLLVRRDRLVALDPRRGGVAWERALPAAPGARRGGGQGVTDRFHDAVATPTGFAVLVTQEGQRGLLGLSSSGDLTYDRRLWPAIPRDLHVVYPYFARYRLASAGSLDRAGVARGRDEVTVELAHDAELAPARRVLGDGRLVALGDRVLATIDGVVFSAAAAHGGLLWVRERSFGVHVAGARAVLVRLAAGPYAVEAVTAAGHLVRLDPLDGSSLALPTPPAGVYPAPDPAAPPGRDEARPFVLSLSPLVLGWEPAGGAGFFLTTGAPARRLVRFAQGPLGPLALSGGTLAFPDPEGVVLLDLVSGAELGEPLPWTLAPGPVVTRGGLLLVAGPEGLVVLGPGPAASGPAASGPAASGPAASEPAAPGGGGDVPLARWVDLLGHPDWRLRLRAQERLAQADAGEVGALLERAAREAPTLDARDAAGDLVEQARRRRLFSALAPAAPAWLLADVARGVDLADRLRLLRELVPARERAPDDLRRLVLEAEDPLVRQVLLGMLLKTDAPARDRLAGALADPAQPDALRAGCALALVDAAQAGGSFEALRRVLTDDAADSARLWVLSAVQHGDDPEALMDALPELNRSFTRPVGGGEVSTQDALDALHHALPRLLP